VTAASFQTHLFGTAPDLPEGMRYASGLISLGEEHALLVQLPRLPFKEFKFHGFLGKRRFSAGGLKQAGGPPNFLSALQHVRPKWRVLIPPRSNTRWWSNISPAPSSDGLGIVRDSGTRSAFHCSPFTFRLRRKINTTWVRMCPHGRAAIRLPAAGHVTHGMGAQHPTTRDAFGNLSHGAQSGAKAAKLRMVSQ
jgi:hypothetical protein